MKHNYWLMAAGIGSIAAGFIPDPLDAGAAVAGGAVGSIIPVAGTAAGAAVGFTASNLVEIIFGAFLIYAGWEGEA